MSERQKPAGARWRILAHEEGKPLELANRGVFDELVVDDWLHLEQMKERQWCLRVGDARVWIEVGEGGTRVDIERGFFAEPNGQTKT